MRVLLTGAGAPGTSGTSYMLRMGALSDGIELDIFGADRKDIDAHAVGLTEVFEIPFPGEDSYLTGLDEIVRKKKLDLVVPQTTAENAFLAVHSSRISVPVLGLSAENNALLNDKGKLLQAFAEDGLECPRFFVTKSRPELVAAVEKCGHPQAPVVVKPPSSNGMRGVRRLSEASLTYEEFIGSKPDGWSTTLPELLNTLSQASTWPEMVVMEYLDGQEYSVDVLSIGSRVLALPRSRDIIRSGISMKNTLDLEPSIVQLVEEFVTKREVQGLFGFQFIVTEVGPMIIESNPRVQGSMVASLLSGVNPLWIAVKTLLDLPVSESEWTLKNNSGVFSRSWGGLLQFSDGSYERL